MAPAGSIFVIGSGPMIGAHAARLFATHGFTSVALFARAPDHLARDAGLVAAAAPASAVHTYPADVTDPAGLEQALTRAVAEAGAPEVVLYNAARIRPSPFGEYPAEDLVADFKVPNLGLYATARVVLPGLRTLAQSQPEAHPALFVTSGAIIHQPFAPVFSLSMAKAAQASLAKTLAAEYQDVHVALVTVGGPVSPEEEINSPANIATKFWELYEQRQGSWEFEMKVGW